MCMIWLPLPPFSWLTRRKAIQGAGSQSGPGLYFLGEVLRRQTIIVTAYNSRNHPVHCFPHPAFMSIKWRNRSPKLSILFFSRSKKLTKAMQITPNGLLSRLKFLQIWKVSYPWKPKFLLCFQWWSANFFLFYQNLTFSSSLCLGRF